MTHRVAISTRLLARNTGFNLLGLGLPLVVAVAALPVLARELDAPRFGLLGIAWLVMGLAGELGFGRATTRFVAAAQSYDDDRLACTAWAAVLVQAAFGLAAGAALAAATPWLVGRALDVPAPLMAEAEASFYLLAAAVPMVVITAAMRGVLEAAQRFDLVNLVRGPLAVANYALPVLALVVGTGVAGMVLMMLAARVAGLCAFAWMAGRVMPALRRRPAIGGAALGAVVAFGGWTSLSGLISPFLVYADRFLVGALVSLSAVAYYTVPYEVVARLLIVPASLTTTLFPAFSTLHGRGGAGEAAWLAARGVKYTLMLTGLLAVVLIATGPDLLAVWSGEAFGRESGVALQLLAAGIVINATAHVPAVLLLGAGRAKLLGIFHLLELPVHAVVAVLLIRSYGVPGAAAAWCLRATLDAALLFGAAIRVTPLSFGALVRERVPQTGLVLLGLAAAGASSALWLPSAPLRGVGAGVITTAAAAILLLYTIGGPERARLVRLAAPARASS